ncbi:MAG TPA: CoA pyrophosphatase [Candidatus Binataceae bacterium]|nr:CoA pyrophosphatase [Candidatus Binataceae bacterium]
MSPERSLALLRERLAPTRAQAYPIADPAKKTAAVLVPLFEREDKLQVLYTRRADFLPSHQGEVAFPGGKVEKTDADLLATALRETHEEIGLRPEAVEVLGSLSMISTLASGFSVAPFVGVISYPMKLRADPSEVAEIFSVPLDVLSDQRFRGNYRWRQGADYPAILYGEQTIWGLTMRITLALLELLQERAA